jgi:hypothetical protein
VATIAGTHNNLPVTLEFTLHALQQMQSRSISEKEVVQCISNPNQRNLPTNSPDRKRYRWYVGIATKYIDVVFKFKSPTEILIITAMDGP